MPHCYIICKYFYVTGYQRELTFQRIDGSFSAFGDRDKSGSTWLTAFVVMSFAQASPYIYIDSITIDRAIDWLVGKYCQSCGLFYEPGRILDKAMMVIVLPL